MCRKSDTRTGGTLRRRGSMRVLIAAVLGTVFISFAHGAARKWTEEAKTVEIERAIEILNPEHREHYDSIETVNEACRMGMRALEKQIPKKPRITLHGTTDYNTTCKCRSCGSFVNTTDNYCRTCGQAIERSNT